MSVVSRRRWIDWLPALVAFPFLLLFLATALPRVGVPFELEWNEGHSAEQAWRAVQGLPIYPMPGDAWVPYMYPPGYHLALGAIFRATNRPHLGWGRLLSVLGTLATAAALYRLVHDRTRRAPDALFAALFWFAWFGPSGFWFDLSRLDALAFGLAAWGMALTLARRPSGRQVVIGMMLLAMGSFVKQTVAPVMLLCFARVLVREHLVVRRTGNPTRPAAMTLLVLLLIGAATVHILERTGNGGLWHYAVRNALRHPSTSLVWMPGDIEPDVLRAQAGEGTAAFLFEYLRAAFAQPPRVWIDGLQHVAVLLPFVVVAAILAGRAGRRPRGLLLAIPVAALAWGALAGYAKFGGYVNNFLPMFLGVSMVTALAPADLRAVFPRRRAAIACVTAAVLAAQVAVSGAMLFSPRNQIPPRDSHVAAERLMQWLRERHKAGEVVWIAHHQWYAVRAGHPLLPNPDMIRCAEWAGDPAPEALVVLIEEQRVDWVVLDKMRLEDEWLPASMKSALREHYEPVEVSWYDGLSGRALVPVTGAEMRPLVAWRSRGER
ncbi:MAG: DUF2029 domain-containing protein [Candidatus Sumerlaeia bacterium]|nr:DUF2029 domain-containing protein [Candidatus Sumerlaeia bacterium]